MKTYHVFSEKIIELSQQFVTKETGTTITKSYKNIKNLLSFSSVIVTVNSCFFEIEREKMYEYILHHKDLSDLIYWINKNILMQLDTLESKTLEVRLRIATSMLNKVIDRNKINPLVGVIIHDNFVKNAKGLYFDLQTDELPF